MESKKDIHILIVDDEESIRITFSMFLKREGYGQITTAATFEEALTYINEEQFDLIISDIVLEGATGTELLKYIRQTGVQCPVVMVTGFPNLESAAEAVRLGAFDYISKPVNKDTLLRFVRQALKHWQLKMEKNALPISPGTFFKLTAPVLSMSPNHALAVLLSCKISKFWLTVIIASLTELKITSRYLLNFSFSFCSAFFSIFNCQCLRACRTKRRRVSLLTGFDM